MKKLLFLLLALVLVPLVANARIKVSNRNNASVKTPVDSRVGEPQESRMRSTPSSPGSVPPASVSRRNAHDRAVRVSWAAQSAVRNTDVRIAHVRYADRVSPLEIIVRLPPAWIHVVATQKNDSSFVLTPAAQRSLSEITVGIFEKIASRHITGVTPDQEISVIFIQRWPLRRDLMVFDASMNFAQVADDLRRHNKELLFATQGYASAPTYFSLAEYRYALAHPVIKTKSFRGSTGRMRARGGNNIMT